MKIMSLYVASHYKVCVYHVLMLTCALTLAYAHKYTPTRTCTHAH